MKIRLFFVTLLTIFIFHTQAVSGAVRAYDLTLRQQQITIRDKTAQGMTINGSIPGPTLRFEVGDLARISVRNEMDVSSSIHWHGLLVPPSMDGVPYVTQVPIEPGATFTYEFPIRQSGTYWYHSHTELQEQSGLYGSIVIGDNAYQPDRDHVVLLSDWTTDSPGSILRTLKRGSHWYALEKGSSQSLLGAAKAGKLGDYFRRELQRMEPMDIADIAYDYFLSNGQPETRIEAAGGEQVRLRVINGSATTYFHLNYSGGPMTIISADGQLVEPVEEDLFLIGVAETYDLLVDVPADGSYELRATAQDGSGFTSTWLGSGRRHPAGIVPRPNLYEAMAHGSSGSVLALTPAGTMGMSDGAVAAGMFDKPGMKHGMNDAPNDAAVEMPGHTMQHQQKQEPTKNSMMHGTMDTTHTQPGGHASVGHTAHSPDSAHSMSTTHGQMKEEEKMMVDAPVEAGYTDAPGSARPYGRKFGLLEADIASHAELAREGGAERPSTPYARLRSAKPTTLPADVPIREVRLTLDGDMERYTWFINNKPISETDSIRIREGEIVRFIMINRTMMHHPMHLHGHFFRVINGQDDFAPLKHTVDVAPMSTTVIEFYGNEVGDWFFHCHLLYHMKSGMTRLVHYDGFEPAAEVTEIRSRLYTDPLYFLGRADLSSNMTEGMLQVTDSRVSLEASWEVGWQNVEETAWEGLLSGSYYVNRYFSLLAGVDALGEDSGNEETRGVFGFRYLLPLNFKSTLWADTDGGGRVTLMKELQLTPRFELDLKAKYDSHSQWEGTVELGYQLTGNLSLVANYHSEFGIGAGLRVWF